MTGTDFPHNCIYRCSQSSKLTPVINIRRATMICFVSYVVNVELTENNVCIII